MNIQQKLQQQVSIARYMLLGTVIATVVNLVLLLAGSDFYIVYSSAAAYYLGWFGWLFDGNTVGSLTVIGFGLAAVVLAVFLLTWFLASKNKLWLTVGLGLIIADTLILIILIILFESEWMAFFWELALHGAVIYEMFQGISACKKLEALSQQEFSILEEQP